MCAYAHLDDLEAERRTDKLVIFRISKSVRKIFKNFRIQATTKTPQALAGGPARYMVFGSLCYLLLISMVSNVF